MTLPEVIGAIHPLREAGEIPRREPIGTVVTDSREAGPGCVFVALPGERADGADFVGEAFGKGAAAAIVSEDGARKVPAALSRLHPVFVVRDPLEALGDLARAHRLRHRDIPLVGITGSSGKTTTKEMLYGLLSRHRRVLRNPGNRNNLVGMPLSLLALSGEHDAAIMEMGTNAPGEIARLADIASPDVAVITNIAPAHLEGLRTMEGVAREKGDLFRALPESGVAIVNATDLRVVREAGRCRAEKVYYGVSMNDFSGRILWMDDAGMRIVVRTPAGEFSSSIGTPGEHHLMNALAAAAVAFTLGLRPADMEEGFADFSAVPGRFLARPLRGGGLLLDDSYNANPASTEAALRNLSALARGRRAVVVFGDMLELGQGAPASHLRIGHLIATLSVSRLFTFGQEAAHAARGAVDGGMDPSAVSHTADQERLRMAVREFLSEGDVVLVKGSRGMRLEVVVKDILEGWA
jgi:UDP-N-acetylmuramoyl-tripeptide--D-alanyl-D-alanine ligase